MKCGDAAFNIMKKKKVSLVVFPFYFYYTISAGAARRGSAVGVIYGRGLLKRFIRA